MNKVSKTQIQKLDGFSKKATNVKAYLIGQIGKNSQIPNNSIKLDTILNEIYSVIAQAQALIGARVIILECENNQSLISLYEKHGYKLLDITDETNLKTMYVAVADVQQLPNAKS